MNIPIHCLGLHLLHDSTTIGLFAMPAPEGIGRRCPNQDKEVIMGVMEAFSRIAKSSFEKRQLCEQYAVFHVLKGLHAMAAAQSML